MKSPTLADLRAALGSDDGRPWALVGKGPSFDAVFGAPIELRRVERVRASARILALNHVAAVVPCTIAHAIDVEAVVAPLAADCFVVPSIMHVNCTGRPGMHVGAALQRPSTERSAAVGVLASYAEDGRLIQYVKRAVHVSTAPREVCAMYFSAEAALCVLGLLGAKRIFTIGIDGGDAYAAPFQHLPPLSNGRESFDAQRDHMRDIARSYGMRVQPFPPPP